MTRSFLYLLPGVLNIEIKLKEGKKAEFRTPSLAGGDLSFIFFFAISTGSPIPEHYARECEF